jgi:DNA-binding transcriptional ArsR family regulator
MELDRIIHEPVRLQIMAILGGVDTVDFKFLLSTLGLSKGNLSSHVEKLESAGYVRVMKGFNGKITHTQYALTASGRKALEKHWLALDKLRGSGRNKAERRTAR